MMWIIVANSHCASPAPNWGNKNVVPPIKVDELKRQLTPGLRAAFGVPMQTSFVPQIKRKKGDKE